MNNKILGVVIMGICIFLTGCQTIGKKDNQLRPYRSPLWEAEWIRNGEPIEFEEEKWYPIDSVENLVDLELYPVGTYRDVEFFVEKVDVRPYDRLYTKFGRNKYRVFEKQQKHD